MPQQDDGTVDRNSQRSDGPWPLYVRVLAVSYVLSYAVQVAAGIGLIGTAFVLHGLGHPFEGLPLAFGASGIAVVVLCSVFRRWFVAWGRRNYPEGKPK